MSREKDKKLDIEKVIQNDNVRDTFKKDITSNNSETTGEIPDFTSGEDESSDDTESSE